ncbi:MAG: hypothetical protein ACRD12_20920 [Acidimicrobiales bacterium]
MPSWLYIVIVGSLGLYFIIGAVAWAIIAYQGRDVPDSFSTILATIAGGLVGLLTPSPGGKDDDSSGSGQ